MDLLKASCRCLRCFVFVSNQQHRLLRTSSTVMRRKVISKDPKRFDKKSAKPAVKVWNGISVAELAKALQCDVDDVFECILQSDYADLYESETDKLEDNLLLATIVRKLGAKCELVKAPGSRQRTEHRQAAAAVQDPLQRPTTLALRSSSPRHPVVTVMGHVDHGKTTLLDALRHSNVVDQEFGAITQHISAFLVRLPRDGRLITFLDTPGHAIFSKMRSRGARATDIVVLVVAADDGVMEQTVESIRMAKEADVPMVVAVNKCDKYGVDVNRVKRQLLSHDVVGEEFGGDIQIVPISALKADNLDALCEAILTQADVMNLRADYDCPVEGVVLESRLTTGKGKTCVGLVQHGRLRKGCFLVAGTSWCKVRLMYDDRGAVLTEAPPSTPVEVVGWRDALPTPGEEFRQVESEKKAKQVVTFRQRKSLLDKAAAEQEIIERNREAERQAYIQSRMEKLQKGFVRRDPTVIVQRKKEAISTHEGPSLNIVIKADVDGSLEAILDVYRTYNSKMCKFDVVHCGVGDVTESDLEIAEMFSAVIYCFNVTADQAAKERAKLTNVDIRHHNVIYKLIDDFRQELSSRLPLEQSEVIVGEGRVLQEFMVTEHGRKKSAVAGCAVTKGTISKQDPIRVLHNGEVIYNGEVQSMRRNKEVIGSATSGQEVGIRLMDTSVRFAEGDEIISYKFVENKQEIDWLPPGR